MILRTTYLLILSVIAITACAGNKSALYDDSYFVFKNEKTDNHIAVYGSATVSREQFNRVVLDVEYVLDHMNNDIRKGMLNSNVKMLVVENEDELTDGIEFFLSFLPVESVYVSNEGRDESLPTSSEVGLSTTKLELTYLSVYYSLLTEPGLSGLFEELRDAYDEAASSGIFVPGEAYVDGYVDEIHQNASDNNALKYGSYLYNAYRLYFGDGAGSPGEFTITTRAELKNQNPLGFDFVRAYFDL